MKQKIIYCSRSGRRGMKHASYLSAPRRRRLSAVNRRIWYAFSRSSIYTRFPPALLRRGFKHSMLSFELSLAPLFCVRTSFEHERACLEFKVHVFVGAPLKLLGGEGARYSGQRAGRPMPSPSSRSRPRSMHLSCGGGVSVMPTSVLRRA